MKFTNEEIKVLKKIAQRQIQLEELINGPREEKKLESIICAFLIEETGECNSEYWKGKKCDKEKCPWKYGGSYAMAMGDQGNRLR